MWVNNKHEYRFLERYLTGDKLRDDESVRIALATRDREEAEYYKSDISYSLSNWKKKGNFLEYYAANAAKHPHPSWKSSFYAFERYMAGRQTLQFQHIDTRLIESYKEHLLEKYANNTAWSYLAQLKTCLNHAVREGILEKNPAKDVSISKQETDKVFLTTDEITRMENAECHNQEVKRAFLFSCHTGLRLSDCEALTWKSISEGKLTIRQQKTADMLIIPLSAEAIRLLGTPSTGQVFDLPSRTSIHKSLKKWTKSAGIDKHIGFHTARHTFAVTSLEMDIDIYTLSKLLGHRNLETTQVYAKIVDERKQAATAKRDAYWERHRRGQKDGE